jgi:preprotein translocase subunit SecA
MNLLVKLLSGNEREISKMRKMAESVNAYESRLKLLSDEELRAKTAEFRERLSKGETLDDLLPEAFAVVREGSVRTIGQRHYDVQLIGGIVLHQGRIAEMRTGEGKTLVATLPLYLNALEGKGAHLITVNDYLAKFHANWMGQVYSFLGLTVGALQGSSIETGEYEASYIYDADYVNEEEPLYTHLRRVDKRDAYLADITYGTNHVYGFDYLRDNMAFSGEELAQRELHYAIVDEVDSILIDEARTPLIISGMAEASTDLYYRMDRVIARLVAEQDYTVDEKAKTAMLSDEGITKVEQGIGVENLSDDPELMHHANAALKARTLFKKDVDYVVKDGEVIIVDEFTGRLMFGRRFSDGLHQALEAKEGVKIENESQTLATITYQNYFRLYDKLAGMTGTAKTEEEEFRKIYALDVVTIPTNKPVQRTDFPDVIYKTQEAKLRGMAREIVRLHARLQPVLVGTRSIETSEIVSDRLSAPNLQLLAAVMILRAVIEDKKDLKGEARNERIKLLNTRFGELTLSKLLPLSRELGVKLDMLVPENVQNFASILDVTDDVEIARIGEILSDGIPHNILNAKYHEREAQIIAEAGRLAQVTIATNMAGRGVDILLGGKPDDSNHVLKEDADAVTSAGGLFILGTERHESRRIDNQLRGRAGRQGDPGASRFHVSLEDELWRVFGDKLQNRMMDVWEEDQEIDTKILSRLIEKTQKKMESHYFEMRKQVLQYDDVMNVQREVIYGQRRQILEGVDLRPTIEDYLQKTVANAVGAYCSESVSRSEWNTAELFEMLDDIFPLSLYVKQSDLNGKNPDQLVNLLTEAAETAYAEREKDLTPELMRDLERHIALRAINSKWMEHLDAMDYLREGIGLRSYAQIDPLVAYKKEAFGMFDQMLESIQDEIIRMVYRVRIQREENPYHPAYRNVQMSGGDFAPPPPGIQQAGNPVPIAPQPQSPMRARARAGRNDPCPCGSGKKYKKCCLPKDEQQ